jgi:hypothetical protein
MRGIYSMTFERTKKLLKVLACIFCAASLAACSAIPTKSDFTVTWVSKDGSKSRDQLYEDQKECTRESKITSGPAFFGEAGQGVGGDMRAFNNCMRAKGWVKE